jgi:hypothetical protein
MQSVPGGKVNILGDHSICHSEQKSVYVQCSIPNGFLDRAISLYSSLDVHQDALRRATHHVLTRVAKCIDVDGGIFSNVLY